MYIRINGCMRWIEHELSYASDKCMLTFRLRLWDVGVVDFYEHRDKTSSFHVILKHLHRVQSSAVSDVKPLLRIEFLTIFWLVWPIAYLSGDDRRVWIIGGMVTDKGEQKYLDRNRLQWHFAQNKSHMDCSGIETGLPRGKIMIHLFIYILSSIRFCSYWSVSGPKSRKTISSLVFHSFYFLVDGIGKPAYVLNSLIFLVNAIVNYLYDFVFLYLG